MKTNILSFRRSYKHLKLTRMSGIPNAFFLLELLMKGPCLSTRTHGVTFQKTVVSMVAYPVHIYVSLRLYLLSKYTILYICCCISYTLITVQCFLYVINIKWRVLNTKQVAVSIVASPFHIYRVSLSL